MNRLLFIMAFAGVSFCRAGSIGPIVQVAGGGGGFSGFSGVSFTTPAGGPWMDIQFNFFGVGNSTPAADGTAFILNQAYTMAPISLSGSTTGFLAASTGVSGGIYIFDSSVELLPGTEYWVYENAAVSVGYSNSVASGVAWYVTNSYNTTGFSAQAGSQAGFTLSGDTAAPEPAGQGLALAGLSVLAMIKLWRGARPLRPISPPRPDPQIVTAGQ